MLGLFKNAQKQTGVKHMLQVFLSCILVILIFLCLHILILSVSYPQSSFLGYLNPRSAEKASMTSFLNRPYSPQYLVLLLTLGCVLPKTYFCYELLGKCMKNKSSQKTNSSCEVWVRHQKTTTVQGEEIRKSRCKLAVGYGLVPPSILSFSPFTSSVQVMLQCYCGPTMQNTSP